MERRLLVCTAQLLLALGSSPIVKGQCSLTGIDLAFDPGDNFNFRNEEMLIFAINGRVQGTPSTIIWRRNNVELPIHFITTQFPDINGAYYFIGGDQGTTTCSSSFRTAAVIRGKAPGTYSVTVSNSGGSASNSTFIQDSNPVTDVTVTQSDRTLTASWTTPQNTAPNVVVNYRVFINNENVNSDGASVPFGTNTYTLPNQYNPNERVTVRVRATTIHYWSPTEASAEYRVVGVLAPVFTSSSTTISVTLSLSQPNTSSILPNQYTATLTTSTCPGISVDPIIITTGNSIMFSNIEAGIQYTARVTATNNDVSSSTSTTKTVTTGETAPTGSPGIPTNISVASTSIILSWAEINCIQRNGQIVNYIIRYGEGANRNLMVNTQSASQIYMVPNLKPFTNYTFTVAGATSVGSGPASDASGVIRTDEDIPTAVLNLRVTRGLTSVSLTWRQPEPPNGIITHYTITYSLNGSSLITNTTTSTSFKIGRLPAKTVVSNINVTASTVAGAGPGVTHACITIPDGLPQIQNVVVTVLTETSVRVSWEDPQISSITHYDITYTLVGNRRRQAMTKRVDASATSADITNLMNNREYEFQVTAVAILEDGKTIIGQPSMVTNVVVMSTTIPPPVINNGSQSLSILAAALSSLLVGFAGGVTVTIIVLCVILKRIRRQGKASSKCEQPSQLYEEVILDVNKPQELKLQDNVAYGQVKN